MMRGYLPHGWTIVSPSHVAALLLGLSFGAGPLLAAPRIHCDAPTLMFGKRLDGAPVEHTFTLANRGDQPLTITHVKSCCGATAKLAAQQIPPGGSTTVTVSLRLRGRKGSVKKSLYVASNDPRQPYYRLALEGEVTPALRIMPEALDFGELSTNQVASASVTLKTQNDRDLSVTQVTSSMPCFSGSVEELTHDARTLRVTTVPPLPAGTTSGHLTVTFKDPALGEISIPVSLSVPSELVSIPTSVFYASVEGTEGQSLRRFFCVKSSRDLPFAITGISAPLLDLEHTITRLSPCSYRIMIRSLPPDPDSADAYVTVHTDLDGGALIAIPIVVNR